MQIIFLREHNRIALKLAGLNQDWDDETLFEEARRINIAQFQHINYYEWAKNLFSIDKLRAHEIIFNTKPEEFVSDYDPCVDPRSIESFIHSVFRYFHTQIMGVLFLVSESRSFYEPAFTLSSVKNKPDFLEDECRLDSVVRGLSTQHAKLADTNFDIEAAEDFNQGRLKDLRSTDLQRDRDHGLPPYNDFLEFCNLGRAKSWKDFLIYIPEEHVKRLYSIYESFEDVDLSVGGALERHVPRSLVGPTFLCVSLIQLKNLRKGDRYFFENREQPYPFSEDQLKEIRKSSAARLLCDNTNIERMQPQAFRRISINNELELCSNLPQVDLRKWHVNNPK
ncbi:unnamed protein product [Hermetia illucens]|uniref:Peroxidase n=2 Tax=Hermetia illucens TaxID=343691 RepID=A0A7R8UBY4_HERIL|nr:unnamed protein product [Hermetia illucens]